MPKIKLTKGELKRQRDNLAQFQHYLPVLQLKKQQLQMRILQAKKMLSKKQDDAQSLEKNINSWMGLLADPGVDIKKWILPKEIVSEIQNVAGCALPVYREVKFRDKDYDFFKMPLWVDMGIDKLREFISLEAEIRIVQRQIEILSQELRVTTQRVNLFEKVKIPDCIENIRVIRIYLGDRMANAVGIGKVAKKKIEAIAQEALT